MKNRAVVPLLALWALLVLAIPALAVAPSSPSVAPFALDIEGVARSTDALPITELESHRLSVPGGRLSVAVPIHWTGLSICAGGGLGGSWNTFEGPGYAGRISYIEWTVEGGLAHRILSGPRGGLDVRACFEYGEQKSWLKNAIVDEEGPHAYWIGGIARMTAYGPRWWILRAIGSVDAGVFRAHANDTASSSENAWVGTTTGFALGIRCEMPQPSE